MIGKWFGDFIGYWFGGGTPLPPVTTPDPVCFPTLKIEKDIFTYEPVQEQDITFSTDLFTYTIQDC